MEAILNPFLAYFVIVDPIGTALIFNALTKGRTDAYCRKMAIRAVCLSTVLVLCFGFWGIDLLRALGIQMESFRIAGGLLLFYVAFGMITKPDTRDDNQPVDEQDDISVFPLSIPLIAGPGCLTLTVLLFSKASEGNGSFTPLVIALLVVYVITLICFLFSKTLAKFVGQTINNILKRLLGVLLASLAIQFIADGVKGLVS
jgi:multiple antibiotic resistance protein